jgi:hypothetical protein
MKKPAPPKAFKGIVWPHVGVSGSSRYRRDNPGGPIEFFFKKDFDRKDVN